MANGVQFGSYHSYTDLLLFLNSKEIGAPSPKTSYISIPFGDGSADLTEASGETKFENRELKFKFTKIGGDFPAVFTDVQNKLHGQKMNITLDSDPNYYYIGRVSVEKWNANAVTGEIEISAVCDPYKYKLDITTQTEYIDTAPILGTNLLANSDFADTTGWVGASCTLTAASNELTCTVTALSSIVSATQDLRTTLTINHKYYVSFSIYPKYANATKIYFSDAYTNLAAPTANAWNRYSAVIENLTETTSEPRFVHNCSANYIVGDTFKIKYAMCVDLTAIFGAGNEPTAAEIDANLSGYSELWFAGEDEIAPGGDGTVTITNGRKTAYPKLTTDASFSIVKGGTTYSYGAVTDIQTTIPLLEGTNTLTCSGTGTLIFEWQEGAL